MGEPRRTGGPPGPGGVFGFQTRWAGGSWARLTDPGRAKGQRRALLRGQGRFRGCAVRSSIFPDLRCSEYLFIHLFTRCLGVRDLHPVLGCVLVGFLGKSLGDTMTVQGLHPTWCSGVSSARIQDNRPCKILGTPPPCNASGTIFPQPQEAE